MCEWDTSDKAVARDYGRWIYEEFANGLLRVGVEKIQYAAPLLRRNERHILNTLPSEVTFAELLTTFCKLLKTHLFNIANSN